VCIPVNSLGDKSGNGGSRDFALLVASLALAVWLAVRVINRRERWAKWALATLASLPVLYVVSFGPACWLDSRR